MRRAEEEFGGMDVRAIPHCRQFSTPQCTILGCRFNETLHHFSADSRGLRLQSVSSHCSELFITIFF